MSIKEQSSKCKNKKQCITCKQAERPTRDCACSTDVRHPRVAMKYNGEGFSYCDGFRPKYRGGGNDKEKREK